MSGKLSCSNYHFIFENLGKDEGELRGLINELYVQSSLTSTGALQAGEKLKLLINLDVSSRSVREIPISEYMMTSLIIASWTFNPSTIKR